MFEIIAIFYEISAVDLVALILERIVMWMHYSYTLLHLNDLDRSRVYICAWTFSPPIWPGSATLCNRWIELLQMIVF